MGLLGNWENEANRCESGIVLFDQETGEKISADNGSSGYANNAFAEWRIEKGVFFIYALLVSRIQK